MRTQRQRCLFLIALLGCLVATAASASAPPHSKTQARGRGGPPRLRWIDPTTLIFEMNAATAIAEPPSPYPKFLTVSGSNFGHGTCICANGVPVRTTYLSRKRLRARLHEIETHLKDDNANVRVRYVDITLRDPATGRETSDKIRFTHFTEGNAGG